MEGVTLHLNEMKPNKEVYDAIPDIRKDKDTWDAFEAGYYSVIDEIKSKLKKIKKNKNNKY
jgi:hypothetical protein